MPPHNLVLSVIGACMLWVGWFGFNAGSALAASGLASSAFVATHFGAAAAAAGLDARRMDAQRQAQRPRRNLRRGGRSGRHHAGGGLRSAHARLAIGFLAGLFCFFMVTIVKCKLGYDDSLDAFGVHGAGGTLGALLTGVFATSLVNPIFKDCRRRRCRSGLLEGNAAQLGHQAVGVFDRARLGAAGSFVCLKIAAALCGLRPSSEQEEDGLDLSMHGEEGYNLES